MRTLRLAAVLVSLAAPAWAQSLDPVGSLATPPAFSGSIPSATATVPGIATLGTGGATPAVSIPINSREYGAICNGVSHPLSGLTSFNGVSVSGWTLSQWQTAYPFVTALSNETDEVAILAAQAVGLTQGRALHIGAGTCMANFTGAVAPSAGQTVNVFGDGPATQISVSGAVQFLSYTMPNNPTGGASNMTFRDMVIYQSQAVLGGSAIAVYGPTTGSGSPFVNVYHVQIGQANAPNNTAGAFANAFLLQDVANAYFIHSDFNGSVNYDLSGANGRNGVGVYLNGNVSKLGFGPNLLDCTFNALDKAVQIGNGTDAYVQGVKFTGGSAVGINQLVLWHSSASSQGNDYLSVVGMDVQNYGVGIDLDTVLTVNLVGDYFIGSFPGAVFFQMAATGNGAQNITIANNELIAYGQSLLGIQIAGTTGQNANSIVGNQFFDFNPTGSVPLKLLSSTNHITVNGNTFSDSNLPQDAGTNNWTNTVYQSSTGRSYSYPAGMPVADPTQPGAAAANPAPLINRMPVADQAKNTFVATNGGSHTVSNNTSWQVYQPPGQIATFTTIMPPNPMDGQEVVFATSQTITAWTVQGNTGQGIQDAPTQLTSGSMVTLRWNVSFSSWQIRAPTLSTINAILASPPAIGSGTAGPVSASTLAVSGNATFGGAELDGSVQYAVLTTGAPSVTVAATSRTLMINPSGTASGTVVFPLSSSISNGFVFRIMCLGVISTLTINYNGTTGTPGTASSCSVNQGREFEYVAGLGLWAEHY